MKRRNQAFTFVEVLAAMVFLAITMPAIVGALITANRASNVAQRSGIATQLAENRLSELMLDNAWSNASSRGEFGDAFPGYRYEMTQRNWENNAMTELVMTVFFKVQGQEHDVQVSTLVNESLTEVPVAEQ
jgi:type II secretory pathway pseudopilin PulG